MEAPKIKTDGGDICGGAFLYLLSVIWTVRQIITEIQI